MLIKRTPGWALPESAATGEAVYRDRRRILQAMGFGSLMAMGLGQAGSALAAAEEMRPTSDLYPVKRNEKYTVDRSLTEEKYATGYNNFYEFGSHKQIAERAQDIKLRPWQIQINGMVEKEMTVDFDDLIRQMPLEERVYRFRCVEAWAMTMPWSGFPLKALVDYAKPLSGAKYVEMQTLADEDVMPGLKAPWYPWPYREGLTIEEATNELAFIATGLYGKPIPKQNGAQLRLVVPWKYGFKNVKSLVRFTFTDKQPDTFWEVVNKREYGFWANINPEVSHPRWSQAREELIGSGDKVPTQLYNGYGEYVAALYADKKEALGDRLYR